MITAALGHCTIEERWTDVAGHEGRSTFFVDRSLRRMKQVWITDEGRWKEKLERSDGPAGSVRFEGEVPTPTGGSARDRTTLTPLADGRVRQVIERSTDRGATWTSWEGIYTRRAPATPPPAEARQLDFWVGKWDLVVSARTAPTSDQWADAKGHSEITRIIGGHGVAERFSADGPGPPWAGRSLSVWVASPGVWRQAWVDDGGSYITVSGGMRGAELVLEGEPRTKNGVTTKMRMVYGDITPTRLLWRWEQTTDDGRTWVTMMKIAYTRRPELDALSARRKLQGRNPEQHRVC